MNVDLFPKSRNVSASGQYVMVNKTKDVIDSIFLNHNRGISTFEFSKENTLVLEDTIYHFDIYKLKEPLIPGDH